MNDLKDKQVQTAIYSMMAISGLSVLLRFFLQWLRKEPLRAEDGFMLFAFVGFFVLATIFIISLPAAYRIIAVGNNELAEYDGLYGDEVLELKVSFASNIIFPMVLWSVKLSLLSISHRVLDRQFQWLRAWWVIVGFVILVYNCQSPQPYVCTSESLILMIVDLHRLLCAHLYFMRHHI